MLPSGRGIRTGAPARYRYKGAPPPTSPPKTPPRWESWWCCVPLPVPDTLSRLSPRPRPQARGPLRADPGTLRRVSPSLPLSWEVWPWLRQEGKDGVSFLGEAIPSPSPHSRGTPEMAALGTPPGQALPFSRGGSQGWRLSGKQSPQAPLPWGRGERAARRGRASGQPRFGDTNVLIIFAEFLYN